ncbi:MAG: bifunctional demethylmenaquinone methyltransferase/2-methoxy-6-polyprenyl-1,4-benzoquinol methylase UbiE [bacterium]
MSPSLPLHLPTQDPQKEKEFAHRVRKMFASIAPRYDLLNHLLSLGTDIYWRRATVGEVRSILSRPGSRTLDLCCGTGDLTLALQRGAKENKGAVLGADFCLPMLQMGEKKFRRASRLNPLLAADALDLPFAERTFDLVTSAFGFRNLASHQAGLREIFRVLKPGGEIALLEFSHVRTPIVGPLFRIYFRWVLPRLGAWLSGVEGPYKYLPDSVGRFPDQAQLRQMMRDCGFTSVRYRNFFGGVASLHRGRKPG